jgi:ABC-type Fe3+/spermidine/putrescine transport system ATPase subunit
VARVDEAGGGIIALPADSQLADGTQVDLAFRWQDVRLSPANGADQWVGEIETVAYLGTHAEYVVRIGETTIRAHVPGSSALPKGSRARCEIDPSMIRIWSGAS